MKTPEEIKKGLRICLFPDEKECLDCPYNDDECCMWRVKEDSLTYIQQLEERIDLMKLQMRGDCGTCKHRDEYKETCRNCLYAFDEKKSHWEYEGFPWERTDGHEKPV